MLVQLSVKILLIHCISLIYYDDTFSYQAFKTPNLKKSGNSGWLTWALNISFDIEFFPQLWRQLKTFAQKLSIFDEHAAIEYRWHTLHVFFFFLSSKYDYAVCNTPYSNPSYTQKWERWDDKAAPRKVLLCSAHTANVDKTITAKPF